MTGTSSLLLVSIITPTYNRASYLEETINSVLSQDYPNIEYIVLDDGSTDNTREILAKHQSRIIWESHPNMGETRTVNKGITMSHGEIIAIVNSDDPLLPKAVSSAVAFLESHPDILVAYPDWLMIGPKSEVISYTKTREYNYLYALTHHYCFPGPGAFIRRRAFDIAGLRDPEFKYMPDLEFWLRLGLHGKFARIPETLATWRRHSGAVSVSEKGLAMAAEHIKLMEKFYSNPNLPPEILKIKKEAFSYACLVAAAVCNNRKAASGYFLKAIQHHPLVPVRNLFRLIALRTVLPIVLPKPLYRVLSWAWCHSALPLKRKVQSRA
jgi:glycosyltransferase involved in cell wall biosynthesis